MKTIYKYALPLEDNFSLAMPAGAQVLCVQVQGGKPYVWALIETEAFMSTRTFSIRGTGHSCEGLRLQAYVGSFQLEDALVFHLFQGSP